MRLHIYLKRDADREVVLNQLYKYSPLQTTVSVILLALVGNRPQTLTIRELLQEFIRHRVTVIRRRTEFLLAEARRRKHTVEGMLIAQIDIDQIIDTIRKSPSRAEAKVRLQAIKMPAELVARALGEEGFKLFQEEQGTADAYSLSPNQTEAIVSMQLGSLANLERENLQGEHKALLEDILEYLRLLSSESNILARVREEMDDLKLKFPDKRRTEVSEDELTDVDKDELIAEEPMVVTLSQRGYVKRTQLSVYQAQNRGGKGIAGAKSDEDDPTEHMFVSSTHAWLLFMTNTGRVFKQKVYDLPLGGRTAKGRALVNLLSLGEGETVQDCIDVRQFTESESLLMATRDGTVKKTSLDKFANIKAGGIIAIKLDEGDALIDVVKVAAGQDIVLSTASGMAIRFCESDARAMGRDTMGVRGIKLGKGDTVVGLTVAEEDATLLTICENGYGKRTPFGIVTDDEEEGEENGAEAAAPEPAGAGGDEESAGDEGASESSGMRYRRQKRGGKGLRDIKTTARNGSVVATEAVHDGDDVLMVSQFGMMQRIRAKDISVIGRNTQGVRIMRLDEGDKVVSIARIPAEVAESETPPAAPGPASPPPSEPA